MPAKTTQKQSRFRSLLSKITNNPSRNKLIVFILGFALLGGGYLVYRSFAADPVSTIVYATYTIKPSGGGYSRSTIETVDTNGGNRKTLSTTTDGSFFRSVAMSPDKTKFTLIKYDKSTFRDSLYTKNVDGSGTVKLVTAGSSGIDHAEWASSKYIYFISSGTIIKRIEVATKKITTVYTADSGYGVDSFDVSPDGTKVIISTFRHSGGGYSLLVRATGSTTQYAKITGNHVAFRDFSWHPDSTYITYAKTPDSTTRQTKEMHYTGTPNVEVSGSNDDVDDVYIGNTATKNFSLSKADGIKNDLMVSNFASSSWAKANSLSYGSDDCTMYFYQPKGNTSSYEFTTVIANGHTAPGCNGNVTTAPRNLYEKLVKIPLNGGSPVTLVNINETYTGANGGSYNTLQRIADYSL